MNPSATHTLVSTGFVRVALMIALAGAFMAVNPADAFAQRDGTHFIIEGSIGTSAPLGVDDSGSRSCRRAASLSSRYTCRTVRFSSESAVGTSNSTPPNFRLSGSRSLTSRHARTQDRQPTHLVASYSTAMASSQLGGSAPPVAASAVFATAVPATAADVARNVLRLTSVMRLFLVGLSRRRASPPSCLPLSRCAAATTPVPARKPPAPIRPTATYVSLPRLAPWPSPTGKYARG